MASDKVGEKEDGDGNISLSRQSSSTDDYEKAVAKIRSLFGVPIQEALESMK